MNNSPLSTLRSPLDLSVATYGQVKDHPYAFAVLPWGATEPHNYHLPYLTDAYLAHAIAVDAVEKAWSAYGVRGMVLPAIPLGAQNPGQREQPFCLHARYETQKAILTDIVASLHTQGITVLVILNGHGGNSFKPMIRDLAVDYPQMLIALCDWFAVEPQAGYFEHKDDHAGEMETSVMMHYYPALVALETAGSGECRPFNIESLNQKVAWAPRNWTKTTVDTGVGNPAKATATKGKRFAEVVTDKIAALLGELATKSLY
ncbi:MAG: creatininase family protein [Dysgonamonadaceae bacterium]|jgi:creatinine amidohydrolase|nr:creatininase family protein [Dysgonamonadaceae bacterium]